MIETEILEPITEEDELLPEEVAALRSEMWAKINEAIALGVFTSHEANEWEAGFEACEHVEHMENLVDIVDDFISSGLAVLEQLSDTLETDLLNEKEKVTWQMQAEELSFPDKLDLVHKLSEILREVARLKRQLNKLLNNPLMPANQAQEFSKKFSEADVSIKEGVLTRAALTAVEIATQSRQVTSRVQSLVNTRQFEAARQALWTTAINILTDAERVNLVSEIDTAEIAHVRQLVRAA